jgi:hypothetical protein
MKKFSFYTSRKIELGFFVLLSVFVRLLASSKEMPPFSFCDEDIYTREIFRLFESRTWQTVEFRAGGLNTYPTLLVEKAVSVLGFESSFEGTVVLGRTISVVLIGALTSIFIYLIANELSNRVVVARLSALIFCISPGVYAYSRILYPDHFVYFFSAGVLYFSLRILRKANYKSDLFFLGAFLGMATSVKYTAMALTIVVLIAFLAKFSSREFAEDRFKSALTSLVFLSLSFFAAIAIINFSAIMSIKSFASGFMFNISNYSQYEANWITGFSFYLFVVYFLIFGVLAGLCAIPGYLWLYRVCKRQFFLLLVFPILFAAYLGNGGLVVNRTMSITIPFVIPVISLGIVLVYDKISSKTGKNLAALSVLLVFLQPLTSLGFSIRNDMQTDSRIIATAWIKDNISPGETVGVNEFCSGISPAEQAGLKVESDPFLSEKLNFYVINSYWPSSFDAHYRGQLGLGQVLNQKYLHFYNLNDRSLYRLKPKSNDLHQNVPAGYELQKVFSFNGPDILILKRID